jgi:hypothetical protein
MRARKTVQREVFRLLVSRSVSFAFVLFEVFSESHLSYLNDRPR